MEGPPPEDPSILDQEQAAQEVTKAHLFILDCVNTNPLPVARSDPRCSSSRRCYLSIFITSIPVTC